jgi:hypothetical protein
MLAGVGVDLLARRPENRQVVRITAGMFAGATILFALIWIVAASTRRGVFQRQDLVLTALSAIVGLSIAGYLWARPGSARSGRTPGSRGARPSTPSVLLGRAWWAAVLLIACETTFLLVAAQPNLPKSSGSRISHTDLALAEAAGTSVIGFGANLCFNTLPIAPELNDELGVHELPAYDPILPASYFTSWNKVSETSAGPSQVFEPVTVFCPAITTATLARLYGVGLVVTVHGAPAPSGSVFEKTLGNVDLYRIPGASVATVSPLGRSGAFPPVTAQGRPVTSTEPYPGAWKFTTDGKITPGESAGTENKARLALRMRVTNVPGWHATIDGRPLQLEPFNGVMLQARVPGGRHEILLTYWPTALTVGLGLAGVGAVGLICALLVEARNSRRRPTLR